jgi:hypothetical protein
MSAIENTSRIIREAGHIARMIERRSNFKRRIDPILAKPTRLNIPEDTILHVMLVLYLFKQTFPKILNNFLLCILIEKCNSGELNWPLLLTRVLDAASLNWTLQRYLSAQQLSPWELLLPPGFSRKWTADKGPIISATAINSHCWHWPLQSLSRNLGFQISALR